MTTWDDTHQTAADPDNPSANEEITATEWNDMVREIKSGRYADWVVYKDSGGTWHAEGPDGATETSGSDPATVLQHAVTNGEYVLIASNMRESNDDRITTTVTVDSALIDARYNRIEGDVDPIFDFRANAQGLHNAQLEGRLSGGGKPSNTLVYANESGRRALPFLKDVNFGFTEGFAAQLAGIQQTSLYNVHVSRCGDFANNGGGLYFTDNEAGGLGSNHFQVFGLQFHGNSMGGPLIRSKTVNGNNIALNGMKLVGLDAENGNQSGAGSSSAHIKLDDAQRLKWSDVYLRGLDAVDYAIDYNFTNGVNVLKNAEIRWDGGVSSGAAIRKHRGTTLRIVNSELHPAGNGGADAIVGDLTNADLKLIDTRVRKNIDIPGTLGGSTEISGGSVKDVNIRKPSLRIHGTAVTSTSGGINESKNILESGGETIPALNADGATDSNGQLALDWEANGILMPTRPVVNVAPRTNHAYDIGFQSATYNSTTYYTGVTVQLYTDLSGTTAGSGNAVSIDVRARD